MKDHNDPNRWSQGPPFLLQSPDGWPEKPNPDPPEERGRLEDFLWHYNHLTCYLWPRIKGNETVAELQGAPSLSLPPTAEEYQQAES